MMHRLTRMLLVGLMLAASGANAPAADAEEDEDAEAIAELHELGLDLTKPQTIEFAFLFPELKPAQRLAPKLQARGFQTRIRPAGGGKDYFLYARKRMVVTADAMRDLRRQFEALAKAEKGEYDGWGAPSTR